MKKKFIWLIVSCLMVAALVLASCAPAVVEKKEATVVTKEPEKKVEKVEEVVEEETKYGGILTSSYGQPMLNWDWYNPSVGQNEMLGFIYDQLMIGNWWIDRDVCSFRGIHEYRMRSDAWAGNLAESWENPDPLTVIFHLRKGVRWQNKPPVNGRELTADDVVWNYERFFTVPKYANHSLTQNVESVTAKDKYTVEFKLKQVYSPIMEYAGWLWICPPEVTETYGDMEKWEHQIGTGPWMIDDYVPDSAITYIRNPDYHMKDPDGKQLPYLDGVKMLFIDDMATQLAAIRTRKLDLQTFETAITWENKPSLEATNPELKFSMAPEGALWSMWLKSTKEPTSNVKVRQAMSMAVNRDEIANEMFGGTASAFAWPAGPEWDCYTPLDECPAAIQEIYRWSPDNVAKAKALLAEAGYPNGFDTSIQYHAAGGFQIWEEAMELVKAYWAEIGINLELRPVDAGTMATLRSMPFPYDDILAAWGGQESPAAVYYFKYRTGGPWNRAIVSDPVIDEYVNKAMAEYDRAKQAEYYKKVTMQILEQCYDVTLPRVNYFPCWNPWVKGYNGEMGLTGSKRGHVFARIWVDEAEREEYK